MKGIHWGVLSLVAATSLTAGCANICRTDGDRGHVVVDRSIYFGLNSSAIGSGERADLRGNIADLKAHPNRHVELQGNADERGSDAYNYKLGLRRAEAVKHALVEGGIHPSRIKIVSEGQNKAKLDCRVESCWQPDRRVDFVILE